DHLAAPAPAQREQAAEDPEVEAERHRAEPQEPAGQAEEEQAPDQEQEEREPVEDALDDDGGEGEGGRDGFGAAEGVGADELADAGREHVVGHEPDQGDPEEPVDPDRLDRRQEDAPAQSGEPEPDREAQDDDGAPPGLNRLQGSADLAEVDPVEREPQEGEADRDPQPELPGHVSSPRGHPPPPRPGSPGGGGGGRRTGGPARRTAASRPARRPRCAS